MTSEWARPECDVRSRNALAAGTEQGSWVLKGNDGVEEYRSLQIGLDWRNFEALQLWR